MRLRAGILVSVVLILFCANVIIFWSLFEGRNLEVTVLDIGQGDAILVRGPTGVTMLVDGGPDRSVLRELGATLPFWDREIDVVVATHPDKDHIGGLPDVFQNYEVKSFIDSGSEGDTKAAAALAAAVSDEPGITYMTACRGMRLNLGGGAYADVLYPDRDVSKLETNDGSILMRLVYGETSFMLTGDLTTKIEDWLLVLDANDGELDVDVLKAGHHGSKYSTSVGWLTALSPATVAVSVGAHNSYGHPTPEVLSRVEAAGAEVFRTDTEGRITFVSNGVEIRKKQFK